MASEIVLQLVVNDEIADGCNYAACAVEIVPELDADYCSHSRLNLFLSQVLRIPDICRTRRVPTLLWLFPSRITSTILAHNIRNSSVVKPVVKPIISIYQ